MGFPINVGAFIPERKDKITKILDELYDFVEENDLSKIKFNPVMNLDNLRKKYYTTYKSTSV